MTDIGGDFLSLRAYLAGDLPADQLRLIEDRLERDPGLVRELELHLRLREGLGQVQTQRVRAVVAARRGQLRAWSSGLAAAAGCAGLALLLWTRQAPLDSPILQAAAQAAPLAAQFTFIPVRGSSRPDLDLPVRGLIELRAAAGQPEGGGPYRLSLVREDGRGGADALGALAGLTVGTDGYLHVYVDAARLAPGEYLLRVDPDFAATAGTAFRFSLHARAH